MKARTQQIVLSLLALGLAVLAWYLLPRRSLQPAPVFPPSNALQRPTVVRTTNTPQPSALPLAASPAEPMQPARRDEVVGVGVVLVRSGPDPDNQVIQIRNVLPGSPADLAGLTGPLIVHKVDDTSVEGLPLVDCVNLVRGPAGSKVRLELSKPMNEERFTVDLTREKVNLGPSRVR